MAGRISMLLLLLPVLVPVMDAAAGGLTPGFYQQSFGARGLLPWRCVVRGHRRHGCPGRHCSGKTTKVSIISEERKNAKELTILISLGFSQSGGPTIPILTGRRDGTTASAKQADDSLFPPQTPLDRVLSVFQSQGLDTVDTVALLGISRLLDLLARNIVRSCAGGHTLGVSHCPSVVNRLYPRMDSSLPLGFGASLRLRCPATIPMNNLSIIANDFTNLAFDNRFYSDVIAGTGVLTVDQQLASDPRTRGIVNQFAADRAAFFRAFARGFQKMSHLNVLTSNAGQVRRSCRTAN
ncbi:peroxidase 42 [Selaginella moellendorffii]|uniref:peroxidase 42 n=1 Tax=Selaginella moellendorffii TaxID=88036 RepID=UPI000D1CD7B6|nr:peroxidase 42 [Selaginella moellendorffii]|eukprot:XP_024536964.1 peroxidase 42 [Selaginella moellendorffii]